MKHCQYMGRGLLGRQDATESYWGELLTGEL